MNHPLVLAITIGVTGIAALVNFLRSRRLQQITYTHNSPKHEQGDLFKRCPICREYILPVHQRFKLGCEHDFHKECLAAVFEAEGVGYRSCPSCRRHVSEQQACAVMKLKVF